jgi:hypothetical protein
MKNMFWFEMGKKRKSEPACPATLTIQETQGLFGVSDDARLKIFNAACRALDKPEQQSKSHSWKKKCAEVCPDVFTRVSVDGVLSNEPLYFYIASIKKLLQHILSTCKGYAAEVQKCLQRDPAICFDIVMYNDEAQGGNLLSPNSGKKASLWYFCLRQVEWRWCDVVWHPLCLIPHNDFDKAAGGFSCNHAENF